MNSGLKGFQELFVETWAVYKNRGLTILGVMLVTSLIMMGLVVLLALMGALFMGGLENTAALIEQGQLNRPVVVLLGLFFLVVLLFALWSQSATIAAAVDETLGVRDALRTGWRKMRAMGWILLLVSSIVIAGFLCFIVPGVLFSVSLMFALYPLYDDDLQGMDAVLASHYFVKGRWWNTFGKLLLIWLIAIVLDFIPLLGQLLYVLFTPFLFLFMVALYRNLKETAPARRQSSAVGRWWLMAGVGIILPILGTVGAIVTLGPQLPAILQQMQQQYQVSAKVKPGKPAINHRPALEQSVPVRPAHPAQLDRQEVWHDPVGDVVDFGVGRWLDIETVSVKAGGDALLLDVRLHFPFAASFNAASTTAQSLYRIAVLYFDTDVNRQTGGTAGKDAARSGYDFGLDITLEAPRNAPHKGQVHVGLFRVENGLKKFLGPLSDDQVQIRSNQVRITIPYSTLGLQAGNRLRLCFVESFQKQGSGLSKDKIIDL